MTWKLTGALFAVLLVFPSVVRGDDDVTQFVVKVSADVSPPDPLNPWRRFGTATSVGSGVIIEGKRILTAAHVVSYAMRIEVQPPRSSKGYRATVITIAPKVDLALLKFEEQDIFPTQAGVKISSELPRPQDRVQVHGYPITGEVLKSSTVICGRAEYKSGLLLVELDGTLTSGYSGGPCVVDNELVGILSLQAEGEAAGFMIPAPEISMFLADSMDGRYDGKPTIPYLATGLSNAALRQRLRLPDEITGGLVFHTQRSASSAQSLMPGDVLTKIGDYRIDENGNVWLSESNLYVNHGYLVPILAQNGMVDVTVFRRGELQTLQIATVPTSQLDLLLCPPLSNQLPSYFVWGPLVFSTVYRETSELLFTQAFSQENAWPTLVELAMTGSPLLQTMALSRAPGDRVVFVVDRISHDTLVGYEDPLFEVVDEVNGEDIQNLAHLAALLRKADAQRAKFVSFKFANPLFGPLVLDREAAFAATDMTQDLLGIRRSCSADLLDVANATIGQH